MLLKTFLGAREVAAGGGRRCTFCGTAADLSEVGKGGAILLLGDIYCPRCAAQALELDKSSATPAVSSGTSSVLIRTPLKPRRPAPPPTLSEGSREDSQAESREGPAPVAPEDGDRRVHERYVPPLQARLALRAGGLVGLLQGDLVRHWLEVSPGGIRAVVSRELVRNQELTARLSARPGSPTFETSVRVRHISPSQKYPGSFVAGFRFVDPPTDFRQWVHDSLCQFPVASAAAARVGQAPKALLAPPQNQ